MLGSTLTRSEDRPSRGAALLRLTVAPGGHYHESNYLGRDVSIPEALARVTLRFAFRLTEPNAAANDGSFEIASLEWGRAPDGMDVNKALLALLGGNRLTSRVAREAYSAMPEVTRDGKARVINDAEWPMVGLAIELPAGGDVSVSFSVDGQRWDVQTFAPGPLPRDRIHLRLGARSYGGIFDKTVLDFDDVELSR